MEDQIASLNTRLWQMEKELEDTRHDLALLNQTRQSPRFFSLRWTMTALLMGVFAIGFGIAIGSTQTGPKVTKFQAPFEIVDEAGKPILRVVDASGFRGVYAMSSQSKEVGYFGEAAGSRTGLLGVVGEPKGFAELSVGDDVGLLTIGASVGQPPLAFLGSGSIHSKSVGVGEQPVEREGISFRLQEEDGTALAELSNGAKGTGAGMALRIRTKEGKVVAGLGVNPDGNGGALKISNSEGNILASVETVKDTGHVNVFESGGRAVANMGGESDGRGFVRVGSPRNIEAVALYVGENGGAVKTQAPDQKLFTILGISSTTTGNPRGDFCAQGNKGQLCFSALAAKSLTPYW